MNSDTKKTKRCSKSKKKKRDVAMEQDEIKNLVFAIKK